MNHNAACSLIFLLAASALAEATNLPPTQITVTTDVLRPASALEPLGFNGFGDSGGSPVSDGNLISQSGFEPATLRILHRVIESGEENGRRWITLDGPGTSNWRLHRNGTFSGAEMRVYRFVDADGQPLPYRDSKRAEGGAIIVLSNATACIPLLTTRVLPKGAPDLPEGGWVVNGPESREEWDALTKDQQIELVRTSRVYYESPEPLRMDDVVIFSREFIWPDPADFHPRLAKEPAQSSWIPVIGEARFVATPDGAPAECHEGVLQLTSTDGVAQVWHKLFGGPARADATWYGTLEEGLTYRYEAWVKGAVLGTLTLGFGENQPGSLAKGYFGDASLNKSFPVTDSWTRVGFEFTAPATPPNGGIEGAILRYEGEGTLLVDNVKLQPVYEPGDADKSYVIPRRMLEALLESQPVSGRKGAARIGSGLSLSPMTKLLAADPASRIQFPGRVQLGALGRTSIPHALQILEATGTSPETRLVPWIITQITHTEQEYLQLIEYLAAPYDPATDTPESKPLAFLRTQQRGHNRPWADDFRQIMIEPGNENWHNRANPDWIGLGRFGAVHGAGTDYGLWGRHIIETMQKSPYWKQHMRVCFGGNYQADVLPDGSVTGYAELATQAARGANHAIGHATYIGPRWETKESGQSTIDDAGVQRTLLAYRSAKAEEWAKAAAAVRKLGELGMTVELVAYEGGPSGFGLRAKTPEEDRAGEYYGKSYAMGTAMLDSALDAWAKGWTHQCYHTFGQGKWWTSHTSISQGFRPAPAWLIQTLINRTLANRDLLKTEVTGAPVLTTQLPGRGKDAEPIAKEVSTVHAHAFGDAKALAVAVVNLDLANPAPVEVRLPIASATSITLHTLAGGPRDTNLDALTVSLETKSLDAAQLKDGVFTATIPPGSPAVFTFE
jgi:hypothetical protein